MRAPDESELLALWERGIARHPLDRTLLLCAWARPDFPTSRLADVPLGLLNRTLLRMREACFGTHISANVDCEHCGKRLEFSLDTRQLLANAGEDDAPAEFEVRGLNFRVPCSRDLAAVAGELEIEAAALRLLRLCCIDRWNESDADFTALLPEAEAAMETLDPCADLNLALSCEECGHQWLAGFNIGTLLWDEIEVRARALLAEVHGLARAYGWTEPEVLALSPQRRAAYLAMAGA